MIQGFSFVELKIDDFGWGEWLCVLKAPYLKKIVAKAKKYYLCGLKIGWPDSSMDRMAVS